MLTTPAVVPFVDGDDDAEAAEVVAVRVCVDDWVELDAESVVLEPESSDVGLEASDVEVVVG